MESRNQTKYFPRSSIYLNIHANFYIIAWQRIYL